MRTRLSLALGLATITLPAQAMAAEERAFDVPRASLSTSLPLLSRQGGVSISVSDPALMLDGTGARAVRVSATSWRIEKQVAPRSVRRPPPPPAAPAAAPPPEAPPYEFIVTATKADLPYSRFAGVVTRMDGDALVAAATGDKAVDEGDLDVLRVLAVAAVERAVLTAC